MVRNHTARLEVRTADLAVKIHRETAVQRVIDYFGLSLPDCRLLCFLDDEGSSSVRDDLGAANRALYAPIHDIADLDGWSNDVRNCIYPSDRYGGRARVIDDFVYLRGSTCIDDVGLTMSLAHELQHAIQHFKERKVWAVNGLVAMDFSRQTIHDLGLEWADIPIEVEARIVSKRVAECFFGELRVRQHIDSRIAQPATDSDRRDWQFIRTLMPSMTVDLTRETQRLLDRVKAYRSELEARLFEKRRNPDYADIDLEAFVALGAECRRGLAQEPEEKEMKQKPAEQDESAVKLREYKAKYKLRQMGGFGGYPCANTLLYGNSRRCHAIHDECLPPKPVRDHHSGFRDKNGAIVAVFQPHISNNLEAISAVAQTWAASKNLECRISVEDSWHFPGQTVLVEFRNPSAISKAKKRR